MGRATVLLARAVLAASSAGACAAPAASVVSAPVVAGDARAPSVPGHGSSSSGASRPRACEQSWALEDAVGAGAQIIVVCGTELQRVPITAGPMVRALDPALEVARQQVCTCAARGLAPASVSLVAMAVPQDGRATVAPGDPDASLDPQVAEAFSACVGTMGVRFPPFQDVSCPDGARVKYVYSLDVELAPEP